MNYTSYVSRVFALLSITVFMISCSQDESEMKPQSQEVNMEFSEFTKDFEQKAADASREMSEAYFDAAIMSTPENWAKVSESEKKLNALYSDKSTFAELKKFKDMNLLTDTIQKRQFEMLYNEMLGKQLDTSLLNEITDKQTAIENKYGQFRAEFDGKKYSDNEIEALLKESNNSQTLKKAWLAHKAIGPTVEQDVKELLKLRNQAANDLGFDNYHEMSLKLSEQDPQEISDLFDELDELTREAYIKLKEEIDTKMSAKYGVKKEELMPWHYQNRFYQEAPHIYDIDFDMYFADKPKEELVEMTKAYYASLGMPIDNIVERSSLYEQEGKNQHAFMINVDRDKKDIRTLNNVISNASWMETLLHEFGHAVYENYYDESLPWTLKEPAHIFTTEAIAMLFGRFATNPQWLEDMGSISAEEKEQIRETSAARLRLQQLVFSRWAQVMYRFEKSMYENPDQDLNKLWWDLVERYQMIKKPEGRDMPDWATKIHVATVPCYYHNYLMGELLASQLYYNIKKNVMNVPENADVSFKGHPEVGQYLKDKVFSVGSKYHWKEMIEKATGEPLTAKYYAKQFVN